MALLAQTWAEALFGSTEKAFPHKIVTYAPQPVDSRSPADANNFLGGDPLKHARGTLALRLGNLSPETCGDVQHVLRVQGNNLMFASQHFVRRSSQATTASSSIMDFAFMLHRMASHAYAWADVLSAAIAPEVADLYACREALFRNQAHRAAVFGTCPHEVPMMLVAEQTFESTVSIVRVVAQHYHEDFGYTPPPHPAAHGSLALEDGHIAVSVAEALCL